jgi:hypothetical protein
VAPAPTVPAPVPAPAPVLPIEPAPSTQTGPRPVQELMNILDNAQNIIPTNPCGPRPVYEAGTNDEDCDDGTRRRKNIRARK